MGRKKSVGLSGLPVSVGTCEEERGTECWVEVGTGVTLTEGEEGCRREVVGIKAVMVEDNGFTYEHVKVFPEQ